MRSSGSFPRRIATVLFLAAAAFAPLHPWAFVPVPRHGDIIVRRPASSRRRDCERRRNGAAAAARRTPSSGGGGDVYHAAPQIGTTTTPAPQQTKPVGSRTVRLPERGTRIRLFYPTTSEAYASASASAAESGGRGGTYEFASRGTDGRMLGLSFLRADSSSGCVADAPLASWDVDCTSDGVGADEDDDDGDEPKRRRQLPLLIYSHGVGGNMDGATCLFRTVASRNVVVAAVEHTDGTASSTVRPDGSELRLNSYLLTERQQLARRAGELLEAADHLPTAVLAQMTAAMEDKESITPVVGSIAVGGIGWGAPSAVMAANGARSGSSIAGLILHDPTLGMGYGMLPPNKADNRLPTVTYLSDAYEKKGVRYGRRTVHVRGCKGGHFGDAMRWKRVRMPGSVDPIQVHEELAQSMANFLWTNDAEVDVVANGSLFEVVR